MAITVKKPALALAVLAAAAVPAQGAALRAQQLIRCTISTDVPITLAPYNGIAVEGGWVDVPLAATAITSKLIDLRTGNPPYDDVLPGGQTWHSATSPYEGRPTAQYPSPPGAPGDAYLITIDVTGSGSPPQPTGGPWHWRFAVDYRLAKPSCPAGALPDEMTTVSPQLLVNLKNLDDEATSLAKDAGSLKPNQLAARLRGLDFILYAKGPAGPIGKLFFGLDELAQAQIELEDARSLSLARPGAISPDAIRTKLDTARQFVELAVKDLEGSDQAVKAAVTLRDEISRQLEAMAAGELTETGIQLGIGRLTDYQTLLSELPTVFGFPAREIYPQVHALDLDFARATNLADNDPTSEDAGTVLDQTSHDALRLETTLRRGPTSNE